MFLAVDPIEAGGDGLYPLNGVVLVKPGAGWSVGDDQQELAVGKSDGIHWYSGRYVVVACRRCGAAAFGRNASQWGFWEANPSLAQRSSFTEAWLLSRPGRSWKGVGSPSRFEAQVGFPQTLPLLRSRSDQVDPRELRGGPMPEPHPTLYHLKVALSIGWRIQPFVFIGQLKSSKIPTVGSPTWAGFAWHWNPKS